MKTMIILGLIVGLAIAAVGFHDRTGAPWLQEQRVQGQQAQSQRQPAGVIVTNRIIVSKGVRTLSEDWSSLPVICEQNQGIEYKIIGGKAESYWVKDAGRPEEKYPFTDNGQTIARTGINGTPRIDQFVWKTGRILRGPVILKFIVYESQTGVE